MSPGSCNQVNVNSHASAHSKTCNRATGCSRPAALQQGSYLSHMHVTRYSHYKKSLFTARCFRSTMTRVQCCPPNVIQFHYIRFKKGQSTVLSTRIGSVQNIHTSSRLHLSIVCGPVHIWSNHFTSHKEKRSKITARTQI
jgi:hypothetical protein